MKRILNLLIFIIFLVGCSNDEYLFLKGNIIHKAEEHCLNIFEPNNDCHIIVKITRVPKDFVDCEEETVYKKVFINVRGLPFYYELYGNSTLLFDDFQYDYRLSGEVINGKDDELCVGDLLTEYFIEINSLTYYKDINVYGIEDCSSDNSGGICSSKYRK